MAVEARHLNLFPPQLLGTSREIMNSIEVNNNLYASQVGFGVPLSGTTTATTTDALLPMYSSVMADSNNNFLLPYQQQQKMATAIKSEVSGLSTFNNNNISQIPASRKRPRDCMNGNGNPLFSSYQTPLQSNNNNKATGVAPFSFLGHDFSLQIQQQQLDVDRLISHHMEKVRAEFEDKRKRQARRIIQVIEEGMLKRLRAKEDEIDKIGKLNWALEEKVKSLCIENQIWRDLAQSNEATANALRSNLEQVLAVKEDQQRYHHQSMEDAAALMDDAQSCCGSNDDCFENRFVGRRENEDEAPESSNSSSSRMCRNCGKAESCVLLLPCRHLCLCSACESSLHSCPICKSTKNASFHVNMS
ncbi:unnamed protein product [Linum tenue]|uniref:RING-type domain-containing protein n=1 Tax=Linum tenue TaxID=586396 RepID=A0AAV0REA8_9ROSI|nr:unnamed protein product [Linum tenue]